MTVGGGTDRADGIVLAHCAWRSVLAPGQVYLALPNASRPVVIAQRDRAVLGYVRESLLAAPPGSRRPEWLVPLAGRALAASALWRLIPTVRGARIATRNRAERSLADWLASAGYRVLVLDHSRDPDARFVLLLFTPGQRSPSIAIKVPAATAAVDRVEAEADRLQALDLRRLGPLADTVPIALGRPDGVAGSLLVTTAQPGVPMLVRYHRRAHTRRPERVQADFDAAATWLRRMQERTVGGSAYLDLAGGTEASARRALSGLRDVNRVVAALEALRSRLRRQTCAQTLVHGDYWCGNILVRDGQVSGVVDWERGETLGSPVRDLARFAVAYSLYLDRHTAPGRPVAGHPGLIARSAGGGVDYVLHASGWYPELVRTYLSTGLGHLQLPLSLWRDALLAELAAIATEATEPGFARDTWRAFAEASRP